MSLDIEKKPEYLHVSVSGNFSLGEAKRTFFEILDAVVRHKALKILFDGRGLVGEPQTMERFYYGEFAAVETEKAMARAKFHHPRFAYLLLPPVLDPNRFGETVAVNRGMEVRTFEHFEDAAAWLGLSSTKE